MVRSLAFFLTYSQPSILSFIFLHSSSQFGFDDLSVNWSSSHLSSRALTVSINDSIFAFSPLSCGVPQRSVLGPMLFTLDTVPLGSMISRNSLIYTVSFIRWWYPAVYLFHFNELCSIYLLKHHTSLSFSPRWTWTNCSSIHRKLYSWSLAENNNVSNLLISQTMISAIISSQSVSLLAILVPTVSVTCISLIKSTLYLNLVIFTFVTVVEFVIFSSFGSNSSCEFTCLQQQTWLMQLTILCYLTS